jgi:predicted lipoprotein with Yx(FWY)xxD motif
MPSTGVMRTAFRVTRGMQLRLMDMRSFLAIPASCGVLVLVALGCGSGSSGADPQPRAARAATGATASPTKPKSSTAHRPVAVTVTKTRYGKMLFDRKGRALYLFTRDRGSGSRCHGACADAWPPYLRKRPLRAGKGAQTALLGTSRRSDGSSQVTYRGHPLYYYVGDREPGQVLCQDVEEYGGHWYVVSPAGAAIR